MRGLRVGCRGRATRLKRCSALFVVEPVVGFAMARVFLFSSIVALALSMLCVAFADAGCFAARRAARQQARFAGCSGAVACQGLDVGGCASGPVVARPVAPVPVGALSADDVRDLRAAVEEVRARLRALEVPKK